MTVSLQDVRKAYLSVVAAGNKPTNEAIRDALGKGSFTHISVLLGAVAEEDAAGREALRSAPAALRAEFEFALGSLWEAAESAAKIEAVMTAEAAQTERDRAIASVASIEAELRSLKVELAQQERVAEERARERDSARQRETQALKDAADATRRAVGFETSLKAAWRHCAELEDALTKANARIDDLIARVPRLTGANAAAADDPPPFQPILP